jgi:hypothetical protein
VLLEQLQILWRRFNSRERQIECCISLLLQLDSQRAVQFAPFPVAHAYTLRMTTLLLLLLLLMKLLLLSWSDRVTVW